MQLMLYLAARSSLWGTAQLIYTLAAKLNLIIDFGKKQNGYGCSYWVAFLGKIRRLVKQYFGNVQKLWHHDI